MFESDCVQLGNCQTGRDFDGVHGRQRGDRRIKKVGARDGGKRLVRRLKVGQRAQTILLLSFYLSFTLCTVLAYIVIIKVFILSHCENVVFFYSYVPSPTISLHHLIFTFTYGLLSDVCVCTCSLRVCDNIVTCGWQRYVSQT